MSSFTSYYYDYVFLLVILYSIGDFIREALITTAFPTFFIRKKIQEKEVEKKKKDEEKEIRHV